ncbi:MAG: hypothetical protein QOD69_961, partial [Solirubrobacteraceae bacterium]|nr:hypothetical protein [Solirubrobacteraceae bacterium]
DDETAKLARAIRRDEERMATYLLKLIPSLAKAVVQEEIPASERKPAVKRAGAAASRARSGGGRSRATASRPRAARGSRAKARSTA